MIRNLPLEYRDDSTERRQGLALELKLAEPDAGTGFITGYGSTFGGKPDSYGDVIAAGAFAKSLDQHNAEGTAPSMLWAHDTREIIGKWTELREDDRGLFVRGALNLETQRGREALSLIKEGAVSGLSIGFNVVPGGRTFVGEVRTLTEVNLWEISIVAIPANGRARINTVKSDGTDQVADVITSSREFEAFLRKAGFAKAAAQKLTAGGWPALAAGDPEPRNLTPLIEQLQASMAELQRRSQK